jgi:hypothetical protein
MVVYEGVHTTNPSTRVLEDQMSKPYSEHTDDCMIKQIGDMGSICTCSEHSPSAREQGPVTISKDAADFLACPACQFEQKYGTEKNPRPVQDLEIHQCGQKTCPLCNGYTVIYGQHVWGPYITGGDPCPMCKKTGRISGKAAARYQKICGCYVPIAEMKTATEGVHTGSIFSVLENSALCTEPWLHVRGSTQNADGTYTKNGTNCHFEPAADVIKAHIEYAVNCTKDN